MTGNHFTDTNLYLVPYDSARRDWRMGQGPQHFLQNGLPGALQAAAPQAGGCNLRTQIIETGQPFPAEIATAFELYGKLASAVRAEPREGTRSVVLSGNCGAALGTLSGISGEAVGVIWFDAHGDFNTPETTRSGYLDGMGLAVAAGLCWTKLATAIPGFRPLAGRSILHVGSSDLEAPEERLMREHGLGLFPLAQWRAEGLDGLALALDRLAETVSAVYLHLDLDVLHPAQTRANHFPAVDGLQPEQVKAAIGLIRERLAIRAVGVASYDPAYDPHGNTLRAGIDLVAAAVGNL
jgi:arginase